MPRRAATTTPAVPGRCFGYVRVSSDAQVEDGQSLDVQQSQLHGWAQMAGRSIDQMVIEPGVSAGIPFAERPEASKLLATMRRGDTLVGRHMDRLFRDSRDCLNTVHVLKERGISFRLLNLGGGMDELTANGQSRFFLQVMAAVAELERARIGERIRDTKRAQKSRGEFLGGVPPFGWKVVGEGKDKGLVAVPEQQAVLTRMHALRAEGQSLRAIADQITAEGVPISHMGVKKVLAANAIPAPPPPPVSRHAALLAELDARKAADIEYRQAFSTGTKARLKKGETWRRRLKAWVDTGAESA